MNYVNRVAVKEKWAKHEWALKEGESKRDHTQKRYSLAEERAKEELFEWENGYSGAYERSLRVRRH